jgi:hypothetical protein
MINKIEEILRLKRDHINAFLAPARSDAERDFFLSAYRFLEFEKYGDDDNYLKNEKIDFSHASGNLVYIDQLYGADDNENNLDVNKLFSQFNEPRFYYPVGIRLVLKL